MTEACWATEYSASLEVFDGTCFFSEILLPLTGMPSLSGVLRENLMVGCQALQMFTFCEFLWVWSKTAISIHRGCQRAQEQCLAVIRQVMSLSSPFTSNFCGWGAWPCHSWSAVMVPAKHYPQLLW